MGFFCLASFLLTGNVRAQTFVVSNLDEANSLNSVVVQDNQSRATSFTTGSYPHQLQSVVIDFAGVNTFHGQGQIVALHEDSVSGTAPGSLIYAFPDPSSEGLDFGQLRFTPLSTNDPESSRLEANTRYWLVFGTAIAPAGVNTSFILDTTTSSAQTGQWDIRNNHLFSSNQGSSWGNAPGATRALQFGIEALIIPEPSEYLLASALSIAFFILTKRRKSNRSLSLQNPMHHPC